jgi:hypothetical protein
VETVEASGVGSLPGVSKLGGERSIDCETDSRGADKPAEGDDPLLGRVEVGVDGKEGSKRMWVGDIGIKGTVLIDYGVVSQFSALIATQNLVPRLMHFESQKDQHWSGA